MHLVNIVLSAFCLFALACAEQQNATAENNPVDDAKKTDLGELQRKLASMAQNIPKQNLKDKQQLAEQFVKEYMARQNAARMPFGSVTAQANGRPVAYETYPNVALPAVTSYLMPAASSYAPAYAMQMRANQGYGGGGGYGGGSRGGSSRGGHSGYGDGSGRGGGYGGGSGRGGGYGGNRGQQSSYGNSNSYSSQSSGGYSQSSQSYGSGGGGGGYSQSSQSYGSRGGGGGYSQSSQSYGSGSGGGGGGCGYVQQSSSCGGSSYNRGGAAAGYRSAGYDEPAAASAGVSIPAPACPTNYIISCRPSLQQAPCSSSQASNNYGAAVGSAHSRVY